MAIGHKNVAAITEAIREREPFIIANMSGITTQARGARSVGQMTGTAAKRFQEDEPRYIVWSYGTPIAWVSRKGRVVIPKQKYSATTSNHQGIVRVAFGKYEEI